MSQLQHDLLTSVFQAAGWLADELPWDSWIPHSDGRLLGDFERLEQQTRIALMCPRMAILWEKLSRQRLWNVEIFEQLEKLKGWHMRPEDREDCWREICVAVDKAQAARKADNECYIPLSLREELFSIFPCRLHSYVMAQDDWTGTDYRLGEAAPDFSVMLHCVNSTAFLEQNRAFYDAFRAACQTMENKYAR